jgi:type VI secretion system secreted protein Hcp
VQPQLQRFAGGMASAAITEISPISLTKFLDKSSPLLFINCATGKRIPTATITAERDDSAFDFFTITLADVLISSVSQGASEGGIVESMSSSFTKLTLTYVPQNPNGSAAVPVTVSFDLKANKTFTTPQ